MIKATLHWKDDTSFIRFWLEDPKGVVLQIERWGEVQVQTPRGPGSVAHLLALLDDEEAHLDVSGTQVLLGMPLVAALDAPGLQRLGLPDPAPYRLEVRGRGLLSNPDFRIEYRLLTTQGRAVLGMKRTGALLTVGTRQYSLLEPLYSLICDFDAFNSTPPQDIDSRFLRWSNLSQRLPDDALVDEHLRTMHIVRADAFTLDLSDSGDILPVPLAKTNVLPEAEHAQETTSDSTHPLLPPAAQRSFTTRFLRMPKAQVRYALEGSWYLVLSPPLQKAWEVVKEYQYRPIEERRAFFSNPQAVLKDRLGDLLGEAELENLFQETPHFLSKRIQYLGEWRPKACVYVMPSRQPWLPPEETRIAIPLPDRVIEVTVKDIPELIQTIRQAAHQGKDQVVHGGQSIPVTDQTIEAFERVLKPKGQDNSNDSHTEAHLPASRLVPIILDNINALEYQAVDRQTRGKAGGQPALLQASLYEHQRQGLKWLQEHWATGSPGALLADDMGLGKTLQALAFLAWVQERMESGAYPRRPFLVVAPTGLLKNWEGEAQRHLASPGLGPPMRLYGTNLKNLVRMTHLEQIQELNAADWALTTYETLRDRISLFLGVHWGVVIFDEAQKIKNPSVRMTEMAKSLQTDLTISMTGTPVENRLADLWSIIDVTTPGFLGSLNEFYQKYEKPAQNDPSKATSLSQLLTQGTNPPIMLRRLKEDHLKGLPKKEEVVLEESMGSEQAAAYQEVISRAVAAQRNRGTMLEALHGMRNVSLFARAIGPSGLTDADIEASARLRAMVKILDEIAAKKEKALVFIDRLELQEALIPYLQQRYRLPRPPLRISGEVSGQRRQSRVDEFQSGDPDQFNVMILSPKAGGVGLTLTAANHVIHLTRWWNPAVEDQCSDRAYRIGQTKTVWIYYPMAIHPQYGQHSFDRNLHELLNSKRQLSQNALAPPTASPQEIEQLFTQSMGTTP